MTLQPDAAVRGQLAVLGYHMIGPPSPGGWESWFCIPTETFAQQLSELLDAGWTGADLGTVVQALESPEILPRQAALITFDDAYRSVRAAALPVLRDFGLPAALFVPTDYIGRDNEFDLGSEPREPLCDWDDLLALAEAGVSIQSHTASHAHLSALDDTDLERELTVSKATLERGLGAAVDAFAYPYGDVGKDPDRTCGLLRRAGYRAAFLYGGGPNNVPIGDAYRVTRLAMGPDTELQALLAGDGK